MLGALAAAILTLAAIPAWAQPSIDELWIPGEELDGGWQALAEEPEDPAGDPDLVRWGVRSVGTRHYTRHREGLGEVCSIEIWAFASEPLAESAAAEFSYPNWEITRAGRLLVMLRGQTWRRGEAPRPGVSEVCKGIGEQVRERAAKPGAAPR